MRLRPLRLACPGAFGLGLFVAGCGGSAPAARPGAALAPSAAAPRFADVTALSGIDFRHRHGGRGDKHLIETMGGGVALLDHDGDGDLDAYLVQSGRLPGEPRGEESWSRLYRNRGDGRFEDVTAEAGVANEGAYGMGAAAADYDNDGDVDLYVTNFGPNRLYRNRGDGRFEDVTAVAGVGDGSWSVSAAWGDFDRDGLLDLYVANYVDYRLETAPWCGRTAERLRQYCHPDRFDGVAPRLYRNRGDGRFDDLTVAAGVHATAGKGLGVIASDLDGDLDLDLFAANDSTINYLWRNRGDGTFEDMALASGAGLDADGKVQACMGVDAGDYDGDGILDLFVTNLDLEYNTLYRGRGRLLFSDVSYLAGVARPHLLLVGFGTEFFDHDLDGRPDILVANGHIIDNIERTSDTLTHAQPKSLFRNRGDGTFAQIAETMPDLMRPAVSRGAAFGDVDGDGDVDVLVGNNDTPPQLLRNDGPGHGGFVVVETVGVRSNRQGIGSRLVLEASGRRQVEEVRAGSSYASSSDPRVTFGLGAAARAETLEVRWPSGQVDRHRDLAAGSWVRVEEGRPAVVLTRRSGGGSGR